MTELEIVERANSPADEIARTPADGSHGPNNRLTRAQATCMPDTIPPVNRSRRNLSRSLLTNHGFDIVWTLFDVRNGDSLSFFFSDVTGPNLAGPFPSLLTTTAFVRSSGRWFG